MQSLSQMHSRMNLKLAAAFEAQLRGYWNVDRVAALLRRHIARERKTWRPRKYAAHVSRTFIILIIIVVIITKNSLITDFVFFDVIQTSSTLSEEISGVQRDYTVRWFSTISTGFGLPREVLFLATSLLDEFLQLVRAKPRFLQVIACSCFFLAAKVTLDDDVSGCFSSSLAFIPLFSFGHASPSPVDSMNRTL